MADDTDQEDKTEDPTDRRIEQAIERGDVPKSMEAATFLALAAGMLALFITTTVGLDGFMTGLRRFFEHAHTLPLDPRSLMNLAGKALWTIALVVGIPFLFALAAGIASGLLMHRPLWTTEPMMPKFNRISPLAGFKRVFGREALIQFLKSLIKFTLVGVVMFYVLWPERRQMNRLIQLDPALLLDESAALTFKLIGGVLMVYAFVAAADILYQRFSWRQRLKMTREEMKQEFKETEGSPEIKARIRKLRVEVLKRRMMANVPKASLVLTNPTHYAVALQYKPGMNAPVLLAKGVDSLAMRIRAIATEHDIPIVENPPLARALHARVEIDQEIPEEHYKAVAEVIGYVMRLRQRAF
ncbi:flagellar biosynthesis protein FlhB [Rhabdaerophilum calidifontis]|uniref:flagellar biosynthesis protein FlhB n=1 Tax=Rhabdaerophilum calidifontis TaxID=2604328 RepID=UPI0012394928|nr:flagellar biosynthesis protein FlhB [Rhabdaerophilum calidifontis]